MTDYLKDQIKTASDSMGLALTDKQVGHLVDYLFMMSKWNKVYNLTALREIDKMVTHHLLDSLAVVLPLQHQIELRKFDTGSPINLLDVGSGAGLPGVVLAVCFPHIAVYCLDAVAKKMAFVRQVASTLALKNLSAVHSRIESVNTHYSVITSRAFASLSDFVTNSSHALAENGVWLAMKGKVPQNEIGELPLHVDMFHVEHINVPGLNEERCIVWMQKRADEY